MRAASLLLWIAACGVEVTPQAREGDEDSAPTCQPFTIPAPGGGAWDVVLDETHAYWSYRSQLFRGSLATREVELWFEGSDRFAALASDDAHIYAITGGALLRLPKASGVAEILAEGTFHARDLEVAADGTIFISDQGENLGLGDEHPPALARVSSWHRSTGLELHMELPGFTVGDLEVDAKDVFVFAQQHQDGAALIRISRSTRDVESIPAVGLRRFALTDDEVFFARPTTTAHALLARSRADGTERTVAELSGRVLDALTVAGEDVFFATNVLGFGLSCDIGDPRLHRVPIVGGPAAELEHEADSGMFAASDSNAELVAFAHGGGACNAPGVGVAVYCR